MRMTKKKKIVLICSLTALILVGALMAVYFLTPHFTVGECYGQKITREYYAYVVSSARSALESELGRELSKDDTTLLSERVTKALQREYAVLYLCAIYLPDASLDDYEETLDEMLESVGEDYLDDTGMSEDVFRLEYGFALLESDLRDRIFEGTDWEDTDTLAEYLWNGHAVYYTKRTYKTEAEKNEILAEADPKKGGKNGWVFDGLDPSETEQKILTLSAENPYVDIDGTLYFYNALTDDVREKADGQLSALLEKYRDKEADALWETVYDAIPVTLNAYGEHLNLLTLK